MPGTEIPEAYLPADPPTRFWISADESDGRAWHPFGAPCADVDGLLSFSVIPSRPRSAAARNGGWRSYLMSPHPRSLVAFPPLHPSMLLGMT